MTEVHLPVVGGVSKKALIIGGVGSAAVVGLFLLRKRSSSSAAAAPAGGPDGTTGDPSDPNSIDPATGLTYGQEAAGGSDYLDPGLQDTSQGPTYGATGYYDPNTGQWVYGNSGTGQAAATTNQQWAQNAISYLAGNSSVDTGALAAALGAYLAGRPVTTDQESLIDQAIAAEGYPPVSGPNGNPPGMNVSSAGTGAGGTGGSTGGVTGSGGDGSSAGTGTVGTGGAHGGPITATPVSLHTTQVSKTSAQVAWIAPRIPAGQGPLTGYSVAAYDGGGHLVNGPFHVGTGQLYANIGKLKSKTAYHVNVWCDPAKSGGPHATVSFTTK